MKTGTTSLKYLQLKNDFNKIKDQHYDVSSV